jgi:uncharacterized protein YceK
MKFLITHIAFLASLSLLSGCASMVARIGFDRRRAVVYPGLVLDVRTFINPDYIQIGDGGPTYSSSKKKIYSRTMCIIDAPCSTIIDTLCLPVDIYHAIPKKQSPASQDSPPSSKHPSEEKRQLNNTPTDTVYWTLEDWNENNPFSTNGTKHNGICGGFRHNYKRAGDELEGSREHF